MGRMLASMSEKWRRACRALLPEAKTQAVIDRMQARSGPTDILARHMVAEEAISGQPLIDGVWSMIGSTNLDIRSFLHNDEINAIVLDADFAERMEALFQRDLQESNEITVEQWNRRGLYERLREWAVRLFDYWL